MRIDGREVGFVTIGGDLDPVGELAAEVSDEVSRGVLVAWPHQPCRDELV